MVDLSSSPVPALNEHDHVRGPADLPLLIMYADFSCPYCVLAHERLRSMPVRIAFRHFALKSRIRAGALAAASEAAALQGAFWEMHDALYSDPAHTEDPDLWAHVRRLGLDLERFQSDRRSEAVRERVLGDLRSGLRGGVARTPTLFIDGVAHPGPPTPELLSIVAEAVVR
jgi:protein-disulfide isomerase